MLVPVTRAVTPCMRLAWLLLAVLRSNVHHRPPCRKEVQRAYFRILSQYILECSQDGCASVGAAAQTVTGAAFDVSSTGREFVTKELAEEMFAPMLKPGEVLRWRGSEANGSYVSVCTCVSFTTGEGCSPHHWRAITASTLAC